MTGAGIGTSDGRSGTTRNDLSGSVLGTSIQSGSIQGGVHVHVAEPATGLPVPRQLPAPPAWFTGREAEFRELEAMRRGADPSRPTVAVITGPGGVGKTALSLRWANEVSADFPDGHLFVDLNGFSQDAPTDPGEAVGAFLRALGTPPDRVPVHLAEQTALYRSTTARKSLLIVLDNALSAAQARVLIPSSPTSLVVITSRSKLTGLMGDGARFLEVGPLAPASAFTLLANTVGRDRVAEERERAEDLVALCGGLPIAVRVAAARLLVRSRWSISRVRDELVDEQSRLAGLSPAGELSVRATFDLSYRMLESRTAALYRRLSLHPHGEFGLGVVSSVAQEDGRASETLVESLLQASLLEERAENRYSFHDLLRLHARHRLELDETAEERISSLRRIIEWYLATAMRADEVLTPYRRRLPYEFSVPPFDVVDFQDRSSALSWLEEERTNLVAAGRVAMDNGLAELAWHVSDVLWPLFLLKKHYRDRLEVDRRGVEAARAWGNAFAEADMLKRLGRVSTTARRFAEAEDHLRSSIAIWERLDDPRGVCDTRELLALLYRDTGRVDEALEQFTALVGANEELGAGRPLGLSLINAGTTLVEAERAAEALPHLERAVQVFAGLEQPDPYNQARAVVALASAHCRAGDHPAALRHGTRALEAMTALGSVHGQAEAHQVLGEVAHRTGRSTEARDHFASAERLFRSLGSPQADLLRKRVDSARPPNEE
ncbi:ATP-binding protein [Saccharothrix xinjiangensis]|uniref:ATP-binding protein n=1 Tax=Saccharothrix xinjiangensis TaxID=204798 RepID=A0ABV9XX87_9PSEU